MSNLYVLDTQNLFYGARMVSELHRVDFIKLLGYLEDKYGTGDKYAYIISSIYDNTQFIRMLKHLGCITRLYYVSREKLLRKQKLSWTKWIVEDVIKYVGNYDNIIICSGAGGFIRVKKALKTDALLIVVSCQNIHKKLKEFADIHELIPLEFLVNAKELFETKRSRKKSATASA